MNAAERRLQGFLQEENNLETVGGGTRSSGVSAELASIKGNAPFKAQFDLVVKKCYTKASVIIAATALDASLKTQLPAFIFGNSDFAGGFAKGFQLLNINNWLLASMGIFGKSITVDSVIAANLNIRQGDLLFIFTKTIGADVYNSYIAITCEQVAYGTMLDSISSDRFVINNIRYSVATGLEAQFNNQINLIRQSLFGKLANDFVSPSAYTTQDSFQKNIVDVPLTIGVDKNLVLGTYINYDVPSFRWTVFVLSAEKLVNPLPVRQ